MYKEYEYKLIPLRIRTEVEIRPDVQEIKFAFRSGKEILDDIIAAGKEGWVWHGNDFGHAILRREKNGK